MLNILSPLLAVSQRCASYLNPPINVIMLKVDVAFPASIAHLYVFKGVLFFDSN